MRLEVPDIVLTKDRKRPYYGHFEGFESPRFQIASGLDLILLAIFAKGAAPYRGASEHLHSPSTPFLASTSPSILPSTFRGRGFCISVGGRPIRKAIWASKFLNLDESEHPEATTFYGSNCTQVLRMRRESLQSLYQLLPSRPSITNQ